MGLALDIENQTDKTDERIRKWVDQLKSEFEKDISSADNSFNR